MLQSTVLGKEEIYDGCPFCGCHIVEHRVTYMDDDKNSVFATEVKACVQCGAYYKEIDHGKIIVKDWGNFSIDDRL